MYLIFKNLWYFSEFLRKIITTVWKEITEFLITITSILQLSFQYYNKFQILSSKQR